GASPKEIRRWLRDGPSWQPGRYAVFVTDTVPTWLRPPGNCWGMAVKHPDGSVDLIPDLPPAWDARCTEPMDDRHAPAEPGAPETTAVAKRKKIPATLSDQLRERITRDGRSQPELARVAGIERTSLWRFMTFKRTITLETADRLAAVLKVRLADDR